MKNRRRGNSGNWKKKKEKKYQEISERGREQIKASVLLLIK